VNGRIQGVTGEKEMTKLCCVILLTIASAGAAVLDDSRAPVDRLPGLRDALTIFTRAQAQHDWPTVYEHLHKPKGTKQDFVRERAAPPRGQFHFSAFYPVDTVSVDENVWYVSGCGAYVDPKHRTSHFTSSVHAWYADGEWRFTPVVIEIVKGTKDNFDRCVIPSSRASARH
jgi:hypothetical protein